MRFLLGSLLKWLGPGILFLGVGGYWLLERQQNGAQWDREYQAYDAVRRAQERSAEHSLEKARKLSADVKRFVVEVTTREPRLLDGRDPLHPLSPNVLIVIDRGPYSATTIVGMEPGPYIVLPGDESSDRRLARAPGLDVKTLLLLQCRDVIVGVYHSREKEKREGPDSRSLHENHDALQEQCDAIAYDISETTQTVVQKIGILEGDMPPTEFSSTGGASMSGGLVDGKAVSFALSRLR